MTSAAVLRLMDLKLLIGFKTCVLGVSIQMQYESDYQFLNFNMISLGHCWKWFTDLLFHRFNLRPLGFAWDKNAG